MSPQKIICQALKIFYLLDFEYCTLFYDTADFPHYWKQFSTLLKTIS